MIFTPPPSEQAFKRRLPAGFTLLELSIVLVIIGLLIGGIFVGQSLIHNAQLNAVITEFNRYQTAVQSFKQQYNALPGDMSNATSFWGSAGGTGSDATCAAVASTTATTCNGDGDGWIYTAITWLEGCRFWQHLANAKMIEGAYTGSCYISSAFQEIAGVNEPVSKLNANVMWSVYPGRNLMGGGALEFAADFGTGHTLSLDPGYVLTPKDAWSIDKKIDDGKPGMGNVIAVYWAVCTNAASNADLGTTYKLNSSSLGCGMRFITNF